LLAALKLHQVLHIVPDAPELEGVADVAAKVNINANTNIWGGVPDRLAVAPQPIRTREVSNPWGFTPKDAGGGTQPFSGSTGPNGW